MNSIYNKGVCEMSAYSYRTSRICARQINFSIEDGKIKDLEFIGGCNGNLKAIAKLVSGKDALEVAEILKGNDCNGKGTSCADQLSQALVKAVEAESNNENKQ